MAAVFSSTHNYIDDVNKIIQNNWLENSIKYIKLTRLFQLKVMEIATVKRSGQV